MTAFLDEKSEKEFADRLVAAESFCSKLGFKRIRPEKSVVVGLTKVHVHASDAWFVTFEGTFHIPRPTNELIRIMPQVNRLGSGGAEKNIIESFLKGEEKLETAWKAGHRTEEYLIFALIHGIEFSEITQCSPLILDSPKHLNFPYRWDRTSSIEKENRALAVIYATQMTDSLEEAKRIIDLAPASWMAKALAPNAQTKAD